jgi:large subunit ribosomal protein L15
MAYKVKKRRKMRRYRGSKGHGGGFRQKRRGKGNKGGKGMSGTGKRSNQKTGMAQMIAKKGGFKSYFGKRGMTSASVAKKENKVMNLENARKIYAGKKEIVLDGYKILGDGDGFSATIKAKSASKSAIEKMEKAGGKIVLSSDEEGKKSPAKK